MNPRLLQPTLPWPNEQFLPGNTFSAQPADETSPAVVRRGQLSSICFQLPESRRTSAALQSAGGFLDTDLASRVRAPSSIWPRNCFYLRSVGLSLCGLPAGNTLAVHFHLADIGHHFLVCRQANSATVIQKRTGTVAMDHGLEQRCGHC